MKREGREIGRVGGGECGGRNREKERGREGEEMRGRIDIIMTEEV